MISKDFYWLTNINIYYMAWQFPEFWLVDARSVQRRILQVWTVAMTMVQLPYFVWTGKIKIAPFFDFDSRKMSESNNTLFSEILQTCWVHCHVCVIFVTVKHSRRKTGIIFFKGKGHIINDLLTSLARSVLSRPRSDIFPYRPRARLITS